MNVFVIMPFILNTFFILFVVIFIIRRIKNVFHKVNIKNIGEIIDNVDPEKMQAIINDLAPNSELASKLKKHQNSKLKKKIGSKYSQSEPDPFEDMEKPNSNIINISSTSKMCPRCGTEANIIAKRCSFCNYNFDYE
ncbi:MAG: hypothetical protein AB7U85_08395 [Alphaproteobacteria bacterium]